MTAGNDTRPEAPEIWLEPSCCALGPQNVSLKPGACKEHGNASTLYVRADALRPAAGEGEALYDAIKHGDEVHRAWLREAISKFYAGKPVPPPRSAAASEGEGVTLTFVSGRLPEVLPGNMKLVIAAGISPEGTKTCFPAYYLNAYPLEYTDSCEERGCTHPETEDGCPTTGWFYEESNFEYETCYHPVRGEVIAWAVWPDRESVHAAISAALKPPQSTPEKIAPVQGYSAGIPWAMHLRAYDVYCKEHRPQKALIEGGCRKGFHVGELDEFIPGWREELSELHQLRAAVAKQSSSLALAEENRVLRVHLDQLIEATTNLLIHVDTSTCGGALLTFYHEAKSAKDKARAALSTPSPHPHSENADFQSRVEPWMMACFGPEISSGIVERNHRFLEEALELVQSRGCTRSEAHQLVDYTFDRPEGDGEQETGGVMVTLAALSLATHVNMHEAGEIELRRIWGKIEQIRAKQAAKPKHSPLPAHPHSQREEAFGEMRTLLHDLEAHCAVKTTPRGDLAAHNTEGVALRERMKSVLALAESCK